MFNVQLNSASSNYQAIGLELVTTPDAPAGSDDPAAGTVVYFEYLANPSIARGLYAYLRQKDHQLMSSLMWNRDLEIRLAPGGRYTPLLRRLEGQAFDHVVIAHQGLAASGTTPEAYFISAEGAEPEDWRQRLKQALGIGVLDEWPSRLWQALTHLPAGSPYRGVLRLLPSQGDMQVWELLERGNRTWQKILKEYCLGMAP